MTRKQEPGRGVMDRSPVLRRIVVSFDDETFAAIRARACAEGTSFAEQVRILTEWGLEAERSP